MVTTVEDLPTKTRRAWMLKQKGTSARRIAKIMGCDQRQVYAFHAYARKLLAGTPSKSALKQRAARRFEKLLGTARCECGLLLPCYHGETRDELALSRPGSE